MTDDELAAAKRAAERLLNWRGRVPMEDYEEDAERVARALLALLAEREGAKKGKCEDAVCDPPLTCRYPHCEGGQHE